MADFPKRNTIFMNLHCKKKVGDIPVPSQDVTNLFYGVPGDINLGAGQVLVVLEGGELLRVPEGDGSHHVPAMQKSVSVFGKP
jgi:hypothetical protein